ncbi:MAG: polymer-forming cytoskeletal protein [bacterium]|nr:polymer-forming cytoskeletal protein [bacterium]
MKKTTLLACLAILVLPLAASAYSVKNSDSVYVSKDEVIEGNLYAAGTTLTIDGKVTGDVFCAGQSININGEVEGDVFCAGQSININGKIGGSLRVAGNSITLNGQVARNAVTIGASIVTADSSSVGWDLLILGNIFELRGNIGRDLYGSATKVNLAGQVGKNIDLNFGAKNNNDKSLIISSTAKIDGEVKYKSDKDAAIDPGAVIKGEVIHNFPTAVAKKSHLADLGWWWGKLISIFSALVIGLVLISFWREKIIKITDLMLAKVGPSLGWGILTLLLIPLIVIILLITIIGMPLAFISLALWLIAIYVSKILVGILVGRSLINNYWPKKKDSLILAMIIGIIVAHLIFALPFIGWIIALLAIFWGLGGIMLTLKNRT